MSYKPDFKRALEEKFDKRQIDEINESIKLGKDAHVLFLVSCTNPTGNLIYCNKCEFLYKEDIRRPKSFSCIIKDYIEEEKKRLGIKDY